MIRAKRYLVIAVINGDADYKITHSLESLDSKHEFFSDYGHLRKPDYIIELPTSPRGLEIILKELSKWRRDDKDISK